MSILFGCLAAIAWAIHDLCIWRLGRNHAILNCVLAILLSGLVLVLPAAIVFGGFHDVGRNSILLSVGAGLFYAVAVCALFIAFSIGPIRLAAPIVGAFPVGSVALAAATGTAISVGEYMAIAVILGGITVMAMLGDSQQSDKPNSHVILISALSAIGFFLAFSLGQAAMKNGSELVLIASMRTTAAVAVGVAALVTGRRPMPERGVLLLLCGMGLLDATALGLVLSGGLTDRPEFTVVIASSFGLLTIILARLFFREPMNIPQWICVCGVFTGIGYLSA